MAEWADGVASRRRLLLAAFLALAPPATPIAAEAPLPPFAPASATAAVEASRQAIAAAIAAGRAVWLSPAGDDTWSGGSAATPLASLEAAMALARRDPAIDTVLLADGSYFLPRPLRLEPADAGLTIAAAPGATPVLHGGLDLAGADWTVADDGVAVTQVDTSGLQRGVLDLHVAGERQVEARFPDAVPGDPTTGWLFAAAGTSGHEALAFRPGDIPEDLDGEGLALWVTDAPQWSSNTIQIARVDHPAGVIRLADNVPWHQLGEGSRYFLFAGRQFLDRPGEWHFDPDPNPDLGLGTGTLAFLPPDPAMLRDGTPITAATTESLIEIAGADGVRLHGLTLRDASPHGGDRHPDFLQIGGGAIRVTDTSGVMLTANTIANVGVGITLLSVADTVVAGNTIRHTAGNGILLGMAWGGRGSARVLIEGNTIQDVGHRFIDAAGILFQGTSESRIAGNLIERIAQLGIHGLQNRGPDVDPIHRNVIERNVLRDLNIRTADGGGIKLYAGAPGGAVGNVIRDNWIDGTTHLMSRPDGSFFAADDWHPSRWPQPVSAGLYLDWNIERTLIAGNLVTNSYGGVLLVSSDDNRVEHNIILGGWGAALELADQPAPERPPMAGNLLRGNVVVRDMANSAAVRVYDPTGGPPPARFSGNLYSGPALGPSAFLIQGQGRGGDLAGDIRAWNARADMAEDERLLDPGFRDPAGLDLRLRPDSPLLGLGIELPGEALLVLLQAPRHVPARE